MAILILLSVSAVSAADIDGDSNNLTSADNNEIISSDDANFAQLDSDIQNQIANGRVILDKNYTYDGTSSDSTGVTISQDNLVIEGKNNCTINGNNLARIFTLTGKNITLQNINFIKANDHAVFVEGDDCKIINSNFYYNNNTNGFANPGGAIYWKGNNGQVTNCDFSNNHVNPIQDTRYDRGGSIFWAGNDGVVSYCNFSDCSAFQLGGAISWGNNETVPKNGKIYKCNFRNCTVLYHGGAVSTNGINTTIEECYFTKNTAVHAGALIVGNDAVGSRVLNCNFTFNKLIYNTAVGKIQVGGFSSAGALEIEATNTTVSYCDFINNTVKDGENCEFYTGALKVCAGAENVVLSYCNFINNTVKNYYGAVEWIGFNGTLKHSNFTNNSALEGETGAVKWDADKGTIFDCNFINNTAYKSYAGAVHWDGTNGNLSHSYFFINKASFAGAVYWTKDNGDISYCDFDLNYAELTGGAIQLNGDDNTESIYVVIEKSNFTSNNATHGGAIVCEGNLRDCIVENSEFKYNTASEDGGAVYWLGDNGNVTTSNFTDNTAKNGGAVYLEGNSGIVSDSNFTGNNATNKGGAIYWIGENNEIIKSTFTNNRATDGGAIYYEYSYSGIVRDSNFTGNNATKEGGAIYWEGDDNEIIKSTFTNNRATDGGAILWASVNGNDNVSNSNFIDNIADEKGGAIYWQSDSSSLSNSNFTHNSAKNGGAIYWGASKFYDDGYDAYYWDYGQGCELTYSNFKDNTASENGGALYIFSQNQNIKNNNFTGNTAVYGGAVYSQASQVTIDLAYFNNNNATNGSAIYKTKDSNEFKVLNTLFERNQAHSKEITIKIKGNESYALADVTVTIKMEANDNIANAIWNDGNSNTISFKNIRCEFASSSNGRQLHTFNDNNEMQADSDYQSEDSIWQSAFEDAQLIDIIIRDQNNIVIYNITDGNLQNSENGVLQALPDESNLKVTKTDGSIVIEFTNLNAGTYTVEAVHKEDAYYKEVGSESNFVIYDVTLEINKTANVTFVRDNSLVNYTITVKNTGSGNATEVNITDLLPENLTYYKVNDEIEWGIIKGSGISFKDSYFSVEKITNGSYIKIWFIAQVITDKTGIITNVVQANCKENETLVKSNVNISANMYPSFVNGTNVSVNYGEPIKVPYNSINATDVTYEIFDSNSKTTGVKGTVSPDGIIPVEQLPCGNYTVKWTTVVDENHTTATNTSTIEVKPIPTKISVGNITTYPGENINIPIKVTADDGKPFNGNVTITLPDGSKKTVEIINGSGNAPWHVPEDYTPGKYPDTVKFDGNEKYLPSEGKGTVTVIKIPVDVIVGKVSGSPGDDVTIPIEVITHHGSPFNGKVTVELPDGTKKVVDIVNGKGAVHWKIPKNYKGSNYPVKVSFGGKTYYYPANGTGMVTVIEDPVPNPGHNDTPKEVKKGLAKHETGNPIIALLAVLVMLGVNTKRRK